MEPIQADDYRDVAKPSAPRLSPDGTAVAFVRSVPEDDRSYDASVFLASTDGDASRRFTARAGVDSDPRFSPSGDRLAFVSTRGDDDTAQLWVMPVDGGEARRLTDVPGGVDAPAWSPDGTRIAFVQSTTPEERDRGIDRDAAAADADGAEYERETPDPRVIDRLVYREDTRYLDRTRSHVYVCDVAAEAVTRVTNGEYDHVSPEWGDASTLYYLSERTDDPDDDVVLDVFAADVGDGDGGNGAGAGADTDADAEGDGVPEEHVVRTTGWTADLAATGDGRIAYPRTPEDRTSMRQTDLEVYDRDRDAVTTLTSGLDRTVEPTGFEWGSAGERLYFLTPDEGDVVLRRVEAKAGANASADPETVVGSGHLTGFSVRQGGVAVARSEWDHPGDVFYRPVDTVLGDEEFRRVTRVNADYLDGRAVSEPEEIRFESDDGVEVQGWVLTPPGVDPGADADGDADETYPLAVEIHGGPHAMWSTAGTMWHEFQTLAARGYVVFWSNPRGSTGYGEEFAMAIERDWGEVTMRDVMAGVERVADRAYVDESNAFVTGGSFGGFMTGWIVGQTDFFRGAVAQRGVYDLASFYGSTDAFKLVEWDFGAAPWDDPEFLWEQSPVASAADVETPTLVLHAARDYRVPVNNGEMFYLFLKKAGVDTRLVRYPREGHELSRSGEPGHVVDRIRRIVRWFDGYSDHHNVPRALDRADDDLDANVDAGASVGADADAEADADDVPTATDDAREG